MMPSTNQRLIQIVPRLLPGRCGVSDQAISLARELEAAFGIDTAFVVLNSNEPCNLPFSRVHCAPSQLLDTCLTLCEGRPGVLLVHLSGYGYSADGAPTLLAEALAKVRESGRFQIAVYVHETFATGMPWRSAFWYSRRQRKAVRRIAEGCDLLATNSRYHADWLEQETIRRSTVPIQLLPVFSGAGETQELPSMALREPVLAVFGLAGTRRRSYQRLAPLGKMLNRLGIEEIADIGPQFDAPAEVSGVPVRRMGALSAEGLAGSLSRTLFGFVPHPAFCLAKSSIFASYSAHGTIPVLAEPFSGEVDGLKDGVHLLSPRTATAVQAGGLERCSAAAWRWYSEHRLHVHAATYARLLFPPSADGGTAPGGAAKAAEAWLGKAPA